MKYLILILILFFGEASLAKPQEGSALNPHDHITKKEFKTKVKSNLKKIGRKNGCEILCSFLSYSAWAAFIYVTFFVSIIPLLILLGLILLAILSLTLDNSSGPCMSF